MASSSNHPDASAIIQHLEYLYASNTNVSNFVSVKLYGARNYELWKIQMMCLMATHDMLGLVDEGSIDSSMKDMTKYDTLLKGWIFGSVSEDVLRIVVDSKSFSKAKDVWNTLKSYFDATRSSDQQDSAPTKTDTNTETKDKNVVSTESEAKGEAATQIETKEAEIIDKDLNSADSEAKRQDATQPETEDTKTSDQASLDVILVEAEINDKDINSADIKAKRGDATQPEKKDSTSTEVDKNLQRNAEDKLRLQRAIADQDWDEVCYLLISHTDEITEQIDSDGNTALHMAVGMGRNYVIRIVLWHTDDDLTNIKNSDGSTLLHIAAIVGNKDAAEFLIRKDPNLLDTIDKNKKTPLHKAYENMHLDTIASLLEAAEIQEAQKKKKAAEDKKRKKKKDAKAEKKIKKSSKGNRKDKGAADEDGKTLESVHGGNKKSKETSVDDGKGKEEPNDDGKGKEEPNDDGKGKEAPDDDQKRNEEPDVDGKGDEEPHVDGKGDEEPDVDGKGDEEHDLHRKGKEATKASDDSHLPHVGIGVNVLVNAISAKKYEFASKLVTRNYEYAVKNDDVLMAIARTFPSGLDYVETLFYPSLNNLRDLLVKRTKELFNSLVTFSSSITESMLYILSCEDEFTEVLFMGLGLILGVPAATVYWIFLLIRLILLMAYFPFFVFYYLFWKVAMRVVPFVRNMEHKKKEYDRAKEFLHSVCKRIKEKRPIDSYRSFFEGPFLEAACQNASEVVKEIIDIWPEAIKCTNENGYDIIQLATIHRSEKVYNLIYDPWFPKSIYRTKIDSSGNNMLHLAGRLAPSNKLKLRTGAALQLQRELQWREEVKKLVYPSCITTVNIFNETPEMVFTKEHENIVKEGESWIKTVAGSCSITATLIITIVFAAAITVPGGNRQETGAPVFMKEAAFLVFAISDAISLFSSITALLMFLSILTARFAEEDFLFLLPRRLIIGLCTLLISTAAMMVAFGANLFLVFCQDKMWMLAPICGSAFLPIAIFWKLQVPLIIDLFRSTFVSMFGNGNHNSSILDPNYIRYFFGK